MDLVSFTIAALALYAAAATGAAYYQARQADRLREVSGAIYQVAGNVIDADSDWKPASEKDAGEQLLLDVLADPDGYEAQALVSAEAGTPYSEILVAAKAMETTDALALATGPAS